MRYIDLDRDELMLELEAAGKRFTALLRSLAAGDETKPCAGLLWNVGDVATHMLNVVQRSLADRRRSVAPADLAELNAQSIAEVSERDPQKIADMIDRDMNVIINRVYPKIDDEREFPFHASVMIKVRNALAITVGEFLIHGWDIANACGKEWTLDPHLAALAWRGFLDPLHGWLKKGAANGLNESYLFQLDGEIGTTTLHFRDDSLQIEYNVSDEPKYLIVIHPVDLMLTFPYGRRPASDAALARLAAMFEPI